MSAPSTSDTDHGPDRRSGFFHGRMLKAAALVAACAASYTAGANTSNGYNLPPGVTQISRDIYDLHMEAFWICVGIAIVVFGAMIYSLIKFRHRRVRLRIPPWCTARRWRSSGPSFPWSSSS